MPENRKSIFKHSVVVRGHRTGISLENEFWEGLVEIAKFEKTSAARLIGEVDRVRSTVNLSSAIRVFVFSYFRLGKSRRRRWHALEEVRQR
jgi:predicted DNA-binding ribbon-helix-helix protein